MVDAIQCYDGDGTHNSAHEATFIYQMFGRIRGAERRVGCNGDKLLALLDHVKDAQTEFDRCHPKISVELLDAMETIETFLMHFGIQIFEAPVLFSLQHILRNATQIARNGYRTW